MSLSLKPSLVLCIVIVSVSLTINAEMLQGPSSIVAFRGVNSTFSCRGKGDSILWYINGKHYDFKSSDSFFKKGISLNINQTILLPDKIVSSIITINVMNNNNTELFCVITGPNGANVSEKANLTIIDLPTLVLPESSPNAFEITWKKVYAPSDRTIQTYDVSVIDEGGQTLAEQSISADSDNSGTYSYSYESEQSRSEYPVCSRLVFSVVAIEMDGRRSQSANVSWDEKVKSWDTVSGAVCLLQYDNNTVQISFDTPELCDFQYVYYEITLTQNTDEVEQVTGSSHGNSKIKATSLTGIDLKDGKSYSAKIDVRVDEKMLPKVTTDCILVTTVAPMGLGNQLSESSGLTLTQIIIVSVFAAVAVSMIIINVVAMSCVIFKSKKQSQ